MAAKDNILDAWIMVEHLSEGDFKKDSGRSLNDLQGRDFHSMFLDEIDTRKKEFKSWKEGGIVVYFDVFNFQKKVQKSNLTLVGAVAFLMSFISSSLPDTDYRDDDADDRRYNTDKFQNHFEHQ